MTFAFLVYFILFIIGLVSYFNHKPANVMVCLFAIGTAFFCVLPIEGSLVHPYDLMILLTLIITFIESSKTRGYFKCKDDSIGRIILIILVFTFMVMLGSIILGQETLFFALKTWRVNIVFFIYFYFRKQNWGTINRFVRIMLVFSIIQGLLFYLQLVGIDLLQSGGVDSETTDNVRYKGFPLLSVFFVLLAMFDDRMILSKRLFLFLFFGGALLLSMNRGPIFTILIAYGTYMLMHRRKKNILYLVLFAGVYVVAVAPMLEKRNNEKTSATDEFRTILENPLATHESFTAGSGTALYRIACVTERIDYIVKNPQYIPFGVGTVHENSPKNHYNVFITGLHNDVLKYQKETVSSNDITWVNILMRYGFVGVILFVLLYLTGAKTALPKLKTSNDALFTVAGSMPLALLFASLGTNHFDIAISVLEFLLPFIIISIYSRRAQNI